MLSKDEVATYETLDSIECFSEIFRTFHCRSVSAELVE